MRFPWQPKPALETRDESLSDSFIAALLARAEGKSLAIPAATAALEACTGTVGRAFAAAEVGGRPIVADSLNPYLLEMIGRALIRRGELVFMIDTQGGVLRLLPADSWDVDGGPRPDEWRYRVTLSAPSGTETYEQMPASGVVHFRYASEPSRPWRGLGPLGVAALGGRLSAETVLQLANESSGPVGRLLGTPVDGDDATISKLRDDVAKARGRMVFLESGDWSNAGGGAMAVAETHRYGAEPPQSLVNLQEVATREVVMACGLNSGLWHDLGAATAREAYRLALFGVIAPLGRMVEAELTAKLDDTVTLSWVEMRAADLTGRARAFQSMVLGGMPLADAVAVAGLMMPEG